MARPDFADRPEFARFKRKDGTYPVRTAWPAPTYSHWYPHPFPAEEGKPSLAERLMDPESSHKHA